MTPLAPVTTGIFPGRLDTITYTMTVPTLHEDERRIPWSEVFRYVATPTSTVRPPSLGTECSAALRCCRTDCCQPCQAMRRTTLPRTCSCSKYSCAALRGPSARRCPSQ